MLDGNVEDDPLRESTETVKYESLLTASRMKGPRLPPA